MQQRKRIYHGVSIGILMLDTSFARFNGDIGNGRTWPFNVQFRIVKGATPKEITSLKDEKFLAPFKQAADELVAEGVDGITTTCGFLALYQPQLAAHCPVPVVTSSLLQIPMVTRILPRGKRPAILTFSAAGLTRAHLEAVGVDPQTPIYGMAPGSEFQRWIRNGENGVAFSTLEAEVVDMAARMTAADPTIGAIVCECTNLAPFTRAMARQTGLPVFDIVTLVHWFHRSLRPERFEQD